jgi:hypothetical protein
MSQNLEDKRPCGQNLRNTRGQKAWLPKPHKIQEDKRRDCQNLIKYRRTKDMIVKTS